MRHCSEGRRSRLQSAESTPQLPLRLLVPDRARSWSWSFVEQHDTIITGTYPQKVTEELEESLQNPNPEHPLFLVRTWCKGCGLCVEICPRQVLSMGGLGKVEVVAPERCVSCGMCEMTCPDFALVVGAIERG